MIKGQHQSKDREIVFIDLGQDAPYQETLALQRETREKLIAHDGPQTIFFCEHPPTLTLGKGAKQSHLLLPKEELESQGYKIFETERGGEVTYHGPGQVMCYPILNLNVLRRDVGWYMNSLEEVIIQVLRKYSIEGGRVVAEPGVWLLGDNKRKIASVGVHMNRWHSMHGFALNYLSQQAKFSVINPCGHPDTIMTSISEESPKNQEKIDYQHLVSFIKAALSASLIWPRGT